MRLTQEHQQLFQALFYLKIAELKALCARFNVTAKGDKIFLIEAIQHYIKTGDQLPSKKIPAISRAQSRMKYPLTPQTRILHGAFKNDLKTRIFFKQIIGNHFHYTAWGIDWIKERWYQGNPPTYAEFAQFWQREYEKRKKHKGELKKEWALLNFLERYREENPSASNAECMAAWKTLRQEKVELVKKLIESLEVQSFKQIKISEWDFISELIRKFLPA